MICLLGYLETLLSNKRRLWVGIVRFREGHVESSLNYDPFWVTIIRRPLMFRGPKNPYTLINPKS